ncbi:MAG: hypothetical protein A2V67_18455 [Deltaproteobacteria bacterium RBG_13_61_14]|nr:MAG: hypothetical protein A2V67_18455 [Deltaproteobacteria bacterium RBG_13_61_14]
MEPRLKNLDHLFHPRSVAFVGATESMGKWGFIIFNNLISGGYEGALYPVNPGRESVLGFKAYPTVRDIPGEVDLAVFTVPARQVVAAIPDCVAKGVKAGVVISAGFKEMGGEFADLEAEMVAKARAGGMVLVGPNGQGICCPASKLFPWMPNFYPPDGKMGLVSQSGNVQNILLEGVVKSGFGVSKAVSSGNEADLRAEDFYAYFAEDPSVEVIVSYLEGIADGRRFLEIARAAAAKKPVIVYKAGRTLSGFSAARSHTGAMAVSDQLFDSVCKQAGLIRVHDINEAGIIATSFLHRPLPRGRRVGILTGGGGLGVIAADLCSDLQLQVPALSPETLNQIGKLMPNWWVPGNPVDLVAGLNFQSVMPIMEILMKSGGVDSVMPLFIGPPRLKGTEAPVKHPQAVEFSKVWKGMTQMWGAFAKILFSMMQQVQVPVYLVSNFGDEREIDLGSIMGDNSITIHPTIESACQTIRAMADYFEYQGALREERPGKPGRISLLENTAAIRKPE